MMPKKICRNSLCRTLIDYDKTYCIEHDKDVGRNYNALRPKALAAFYRSTQWRNLRNSFVAAHPLCEICLEKGIVSSVEIVHHKIEVREDWDRRFDWGNLQSVCRSCHNKIHGTGSL